MEASGAVIVFQHDGTPVGAHFLRKMGAEEIDQAVQEATICSRDDDAGEGSIFCRKMAMEDRAIETGTGVSERRSRGF
jgi:hypothetical protein